MASSGHVPVVFLKVHINVQVFVKILGIGADGVVKKRKFPAVTSRCSSDTVFRSAFNQFKAIGAFLRRPFCRRFYVLLRGPGFWFGVVAFEGEDVDAGVGLAD